MAELEDREARRQHGQDERQIDEKAFRKALGLRNVFALAHADLRHIRLRELSNMAPPEGLCNAIALSKIIRRARERRRSAAKAGRWERADPILRRGEENRMDAFRAAT
jgi:hypothetical protein